MIRHAGLGLALAVVAGLVGGDSEEPGLKLAAALKRLEIADDRQEDLLANLLHVLAREIMPKLEDKTPRRRVMPVEQLVPRPGFTAAAALISKSSTSFVLKPEIR